MTNTEKYPALHVPARTIPVPDTVSPEAQTVLAFRPVPQEIWPDDLSDKAAVAEVIKGIDATLAQAPALYAAGNFGTYFQDVDDVAVEHVMFGDVSVYIATPGEVAQDDPRAYLVIHGHWISGGGEFSRLGAALTAKALGVRTWAIDYRMPPYHPYPVPLDDCVAAYRALLETYRPENIAIGGTSGGGNLTLAVLLRGRDEGLPMPAAAVLNTPYADMTHSGDTYQTLRGIDVSYAPGNLEIIRKIYLGDHDLSDPYVSPVLGDYRDFPPTMLCTGTRDFLLSETVRVHRRLLAAGAEAHLHVWEAAQHFFFTGTSPEDFERVTETRRFLDANWAHSPAVRP